MPSSKFVWLAAILLAVGGSCGSSASNNPDAAGGNAASGSGGAGGDGGAGGLDDSGLGGDAGTAGLGDDFGGGGGEMPFACLRHATLENPVFTNFEYLDAVATLSFTTPDGFNGKFFGDDMVNAANFAVATDDDAHSPRHALTISTTTTGFVELGQAFNKISGCLDLSAFAGITFWAKGAGTLTLKITDGTGMQVLGDLTDTYTQYTVTWAQLKHFTPPVLSQRAGRNFLFIATGATLGDSPATLFLDDISFIPPDM